MKSRMDKYYKEEELMQRTSKNDFLYDELYREKQMPSSNVTVLDNVNEIDITKIKDLVDSREKYKKMRDYSNIINDKEEYKSDSIEYDFDEKDSSDYDINEILKKKKANNVEETKVRRLSNQDYEILSSLEEEKVDYLTHEQQLKDLFNTMTKIADDNDLFANLKEEEEDKKEEESFYTNTSKIQNMDFEDETKKEKNPTKVFIIIGIITLLVAVGTIIYIKFIK